MVGVAAGKREDLGRRRPGLTEREVSTQQEQHTLYAIAGVCSLSSVSLHNHKN